MPSTQTLVTVAAAAGVAAAVVYILRQRQLARMPSDEEQAWLDEQLRTPRPSVMSPGSQVSDEEQKWLDKQIQDAETADVRYFGSNCLLPALDCWLSSTRCPFTCADAGRRQASCLRAGGGLLAVEEEGLIARRPHASAAGGSDVPLCKFWVCANGPVMALSWVGQLSSLA